jgi:hypothetical protein
MQHWQKRERERERERERQRDGESVAMSAVSPERIAKTRERESVERV